GEGKVDGADLSEPERAERLALWDGVVTERCLGRRQARSWGPVPFPETNRSAQVLRPTMPWDRSFPRHPRTPPGPNDAAVRCSSEDHLPSLPSLQLRQGHSDTDIVPGRVVVEPAAVIVLAVDADAVQQIAVRRETIDQRLTGEDVPRHRVQVLRLQFA